MAKKAGVSIQRTIYSTFRGADFSTDPSLVERYRSPLCTNIIADGGGMPQKRVGWRTLHELSGRVNGIFSAPFNGSTKMLAHVGTKLYSFTDDSETAPVQLATGLPDQKSRSAYMNGKLWIVTGAGYYVYDGSTAAKVSASGAYVPTTVITRMPTGGGVSYEDINMLTPYRKNAFQTDGSTKVFILDSSIDDTGDVTCWVWGTEVTPSAIDRAEGKITFTNAPAAPQAGQEDGLVVQFPHTVSGYTDRIDKCTIISTYGVGTNDRIVLSGNPDYPNRDWISGLNDPTYIPDLSYSTVGSESTAIMGYCRVGSMQGIVKQDDGRDSSIFLRSAGTNDSGEAIFPMQQAIAGVGSVAPGSFSSLLDDPLFLSREGIYAITSTTITSERLAQQRSYYVNAQLTHEPNLSDAEAVIWNGMYLLALPNGHVYVMDGRQQKSYRSASLGDFVYECYYWENVPARTWMCVRDSVEEELYFGTADGRICKVNSDIESMDKYADDGQAIDAVWATKYDDDGTPALLKTMIKRGCCVTIKPYARSSGTVYFKSDRSGGEARQVTAKPMDILDFTDIDFERFTFNTDDSPQEIFLNRKVKNYKRLQLIVRNSEVNEGFGIFQITKHYVIGNYAKR